MTSTDLRRHPRGPRGSRPRSLSRPSGGFTLLEVMVALVIASIGLLGTVAVQQTMFNATANAGDAAIATRLAMQTLEEQLAKVVTAGPPVVDQLAPAVTAGWSASIYVNALGAVSPGGTSTPDYRFRKQVQITNLGVTQPYNVSVRIVYS